jgi:hypothetical protein
MKTALSLLIALVVVGAGLYLMLGQMPAPTPPVTKPPQAAAASPSPASAPEAAPQPETAEPPAVAAPAEPAAATPEPPVPAPSTPRTPGEPVVFDAPADPDNAAILRVSATAAPGGDGSEAKPFATIEAARDAARAITDRPVRIEIGGGHYMVRNGLVLTAEDSGAPGRRIVYAAAPGEQVRISSGILVPVASLQPVSDPALLARLREDVRDRVRVLPLAGQDLKVRRFPDTFRGIELLEVQAEGRRLPLSRWPDDGRFARMAKVLDNGITPDSNGVFVFNEDDVLRWQGAVEEGLWLRGFWRVPWVIEAARVGSIDPAARSITLAGRIGGGIGSKYTRAPNNGPGPGSGEEPWEAINLIEEISTPGEWAVRFTDDTLYILPPEGADELLVTDVTKPVVHLRNVSHVSLKGLSVDNGLGDGIRVTGGEDVLIAGCKVSNVSRDGIVLEGGWRHTVLSCDTAETGYSGIAYTGGDRASLSPSGHRIINNLVTRAGLFFPAPGINGGLGPRAEAVGVLIAHNRIHDCMNSGIVYAGNDNVFEFNEIYRVGLGSSDLGCFYTNSGWTSRGNIIRHNFVHHSMNANAFYVDDGDCGDTFIGNVAYKTESGGFIGGGHYQTFINNVIVESPRAMHIDSRGIARGYTITDKRLRGDLDSVPYTQPPWSERYPELVGILETETQKPSNIVIEDNLFVRCAKGLRTSGKEGDFDGLSFAGNMESDDLGMFVNPAELDFSLKPDAAVFREISGFDQIPMARIGLFADAYRPSVPPRDMELLRTADTDGGFDSQTDVNASNRPAH